MNQAMEILVISLGTFLVQNIIFKKLSDQVQLREVRLDMEKLNKEMQEAQKSRDLQKLEKVTEKLNDVTMKRFQLTLNPNMISSFVFIFVLNGMRTKYGSLVVQLPVTIPIPVWAMPPVKLTDTLGWFGWYILCGMAANMIIKEILEIEI